MPLKGRGSKAPVKSSSSRTSKGARDENLPINPPVQPPCILKAPVKTSIDGIPFNAFPKKFCRDPYTKVFHQRSLVLEKKLHLESFLDTPIPTLFVKLGWLPLANFFGTTYAPLVRMFYSNIIEHDLDDQGKIKGALGSKKKVGHSKAKRKFAESDSNSDVDSSVLAQLCARFDALDEKISA
ncbi:hypothetical protein PVL29_011757 [Vitis rotundifolia]|uniref:Uncharacterized protein n=1 Tax=Vitis rotundifolia TaxID=103349 RepID=A0AA38ZR08_VITRO|nr:hypothetical protein PVL29_011757 [Vitis rotundifolia]